MLEQFSENLAKLSKSIKIITHKGYSNEFVGKIKDIDFLFIDGDHGIDGCTFDFVNFEKDLKNGGFLAFHDYDTDKSELGLTWAFDNLVRKMNHVNFIKVMTHFVCLRKQLKNFV